MLAGTFKIKKLSMQREGFNPKLVSDPLYFLDATKESYVPLDKGLYHEISERRVRV